MKGIVITGGTGAFGRAFARHLLTPIGERTWYDRIVIYSRGEYQQHLMAKELAGMDSLQRLRFFVGDIRDEARFKRALHGCSTVVHAAALKRIEVGHYNPDEMIKTNIGGSQNVVEACLDSKVKKVVFLSSDKAYQPVSPYGLSKAMAESLFINANNMRGWSGPMFSVCRYGNVWKSTGSVVPTWLAMKERGETTVNVTDPDCTRFFMRMEEAIKLVMDTLESMRGREINIPTLPAYRLGDLAEAMSVEYKVTGLPSWEKKHESMGDGNSSDLARRMSIEELRSEL